MGVRNVKAGSTVKETIVKAIPSAKVDVLELDVSSLASVRKFASEFDKFGLPLNILINNAGVMAIPFSLSPDGYEMQFATNHLGHFLLTNLLLEKMKKTSQDSKREGRIVNVSSEGHRFTYGEGINFDKINDKAAYNSIYAYGQSKLANVLHAKELSSRFKEEGVNITANSLHPGAINTNLLRHHGFLEAISNSVGRLFMKNVEQGAATTCYAALHPQAANISGEYLNNCNVGKGSAKSTDADLAKKLWEFSMKAVN